MKNKFYYLIISALFLTGFALFSKYVDREIFRTIDFAVTVKVQERIDRSAHLRISAVTANVMQGATFFANPVMTSLFVLAFTFLSFYDRKRRRVNIKSVIIPLGFILILLAELFGKSIVHHPSPPFGMIKNPTSLFPASYVNEQFSYPSGHAARAVFVALCGWFWLGKSFGKETVRKRILIGVALGVYVLLVSVSRIYLGEHWLSDVIGGILLGCGLGVLPTLVI